MHAKHILPLTGIRLFAAIWVVAYHSRECLFTLFPALGRLSPFCSIGYEAVPLFFMLSGFILSHNYFSSYSISEHPGFIFNRFARLWPVHAASLALMLIGPDLFSLNGDALKSIAEELLMVRSWFYNALAWNYPAWSVSVEWFAYIFVFPVAFFLFKRIHSWPCAAILVTMFLTAQVSLPPALFPGRCGSIIFLFLTGSGLYRLYRLVKNPPAELIVICGVMLFLCFILSNEFLPRLILYAAFALMIFGLAYERGVLARMLSTRIIVYGGLASYSLYMTHFLTLRSYSFFFWQRLPESLLLRSGILLILLGALAGTAIFFYRYIEEPANRRLRQFMRRDSAIS